MHRWILFLTCLFVTSCCLPISSDNGLDQEIIEDKAKIYNIVIKRWDKLEYSGLLAVKKSHEGLHYILLDPTGVKLLESEIQVQTSESETVAGGVLAHSKLRNFLDTVLQRVYLTYPHKLPCDWNGVLQFCYRKQNRTDWTKITKVWPFVYWEALKEVNRGDSQIIFVYNQPWLGVDITLEEIQ